MKKIKRRLGKRVRNRSKRVKSGMIEKTLRSF